MSKRDIETVCTLAAHLAYATFLALDDPTVSVKITRRAEDCAADAMRLQRLGRRARNNAAKRWQPPDQRGPEYDIGPYMDECARITGEVERVLSPYGLYPRDFSVGVMGVVFLTLPGDYQSLFGKGFLI